MGVIRFVDEFRALHARARQGELDESEQEAYRKAREHFLRALLTAQGMLLDSGASARRSFRVSLGLPVELHLTHGSVWTTTLDVSVGGFSVMVPHPVPPQEEPAYQLRLPRGEPLLGVVRVVSQGRRGDQQRVSFSFVELTELESERLELVLIDFALERVGITPP